MDPKAEKTTEVETDEEVVKQTAEAVEQAAETVESDEVVVTIGEEAPPTEEEKAPEWVRELRRKHRELARENQELKAKLTVETKPTVGAKPKIEDYDYDSDKFADALTAWHDQKRKADEAERTAQAEQEEKAKAWQQSLDGYVAASKELKVPDFEDAESHVQETLSIVQQGILVQGADNPALVVYALGKNPKKLAELQSIKDPVKFAFAVSKLESQLKVANRKPATTPEKVLTGTGSTSGSVDSTLDKLRAEAVLTGDYTKVTAYKRKLKQERK
jgi:hypothetical protein